MIISSLTPLVSTVARMSFGLIPNTSCTYSLTAGVICTPLRLTVWKALMLDCLNPSVTLEMALATSLSPKVLLTFPKISAFVDTALNTSAIRSESLVVK